MINVYILKKNHSNFYSKISTYNIIVHPYVGQITTLALVGEYVTKFQIKIASITQVQQNFKSQIKFNVRTKRMIS